MKSLTMQRKNALALALRARIVLTWAEGGQNEEVAAELDLDTQTVGKWQYRLVKRRVAGLHDEPRSVAPRTIDDSRIDAVVVRTLEKCPRERHPLEFARHGERQRVVGVDGARHLASLRTPAAPAGDVQALDRSALGGQGERRSWAFTSRRRVDESPKSRR
ncbi:helix-turn-helix domain-containing protein [Bradyrhizobium paxllaeri]|uniref:helix-turn-helix domain-containing protein n=1 Tax=Bradyrhizobium paxllaeri TaxID=190148 RepID=UPI0011468620|nr:helix-turn-helix domain-containing protein [Bradyrhizobium paxllaeri]